MPWIVVEENNSYCVHKKNADGTAGETVDCHTTREQADAQVKALYANAGENMEAWAFNFVELSGITDLKKIDGLAAGTFTAMSGDEVTFAVEDLPTYIENTLAVIESTKTESGEIVGLPIDMEGHNHKGGAGWIVGLELDKARNIIRFLVNWTEKGIEVIKANLSRFFSPSTDTDVKVILGGSLTNFPATRNEKGQILLRPVELSQEIKEIDMEKTLLEVLADLPGKVAAAVRGTAETTEVTEPQIEAPNPQIAQLMSDPAQVEELEENVQKLVKQRVNLEMRKNHTERFVAELIGGSKTKPYGFAVKSKDLIAWMLSLTDAQAKFAEKLLNDMKDKSIDFAMHGIDGDGFIQRPELDKNYASLARTWIKSGRTIDEFFKVNPELGHAEDYNLSEFAPKGKE